MHHLPRYPHLQLRPHPCCPGDEPTASGSDINVVPEVTKPEDAIIKEDVIYGHKKSCPTPQCWCTAAVRRKSSKTTAADTHPSPRMQWVVPSITWRRWDRPLVDPPAYPFSHSMRRSWRGPLAYQPHSIIRNRRTWGSCASARARSHGAFSIRGDLSGQGRLRQKRDVFKRPVSDVPPPEGTSMAFRQR